MTRSTMTAGFALLLSAGLLVGAWIFQYGLGYAPCTMCYWQRHAHKVIIALAALALVVGSMSPQTRKPLLALTLLGFLGSAGLAFYHSGVEYSWWEGPKACASGPVDFKFDPDDPLGALDGSFKPPSCDKAVWHFIGLSMASWNGILSLFGAGVVAMFGFKSEAANDR